MSAPQNVVIDSNASRYLGCVKWFDNRKGFGFINNLSTNSEVFVHHTGLSSKEKNCFRTLYPGEYVEFHLYHDESSNRDYAVNVTGVQGGALLCENSGTRLSVRRQRDATSPDQQQQAPSQPRQSGNSRSSRQYGTGNQQEGGFRKVERRAPAPRRGGGRGRPTRASSQAEDTTSA